MQRIYGFFCGITITVEGFCLTTGRIGVAPSAQDELSIGPNELVRARVDGFNPFGFIAQSDAWHLVEIGFFLHTTGVSEDKFGAHL